jgi:hypothetical protein
VGEAGEAVRPLAVLDALPVSLWSAEETLAHLTATFDQAVREHPELLEQYVVMLADADEAVDKLAIMRRGLRETVAERFR